MEYRWDFHRVYPTKNVFSVALYAMIFKHFFNAIHELIISREHRLFCISIVCTDFPIITTDQLCWKFFCLYVLVSLLCNLHAESSMQTNTLPTYSP